MGSMLVFPVRDSAPPQPELPGALTYGSPEHLTNEAIRIMGRVAHLASSLNDSQRVDVLAHFLCLEKEILDPLTAWVERHRTFLSDLSCKQARKRRRRQKRVKRDIELSA